MMTNLNLPANIKNIAVIDDNEKARESLAEAVVDANLTPIIETQPLISIEDLVKRLKRKAHAAICDHHLAPGNYAGFMGAEAVARLYKEQFPAILLTQWSFADIDRIVSFRRSIPVMIKSGELNKGDIARGINKCIGEFKNIYSKDREPWRTLLRIVEVQGRDIYIIIPAWDPDLIIKIPSSLIPAKYHPIKQDMRIFAETNLGATSPEDLYFDKFSSVIKPGA